MSQRARAIADIDAGVLLATVDVAAPPDRVFRALTEDVAAWCGADGASRTDQHTADVRAGGAWRTDSTTATGNHFHVRGEFLAVDAPHTAAQSWQPSWPEPASTVTYRLSPIDGGTRVLVRHEQLEPARCAQHAPGWEEVLDWLAAHFAR